MDPTTTSIATDGSSSVLSYPGSVATNDTRKISKAAERAMDRAYGDHQCCLCGADSINYCYVVPYDKTLRKPAIARLRDLMLVPAVFDHNTELNTIPLAPGLHPSFYRHRWMVYPDREVLIKCIRIEEESLAKRQRAIDEGRQDPGRPTYDDLYEGHLNAKEKFRVIFGEDMGHTALIHINHGWTSAPGGQFTFELLLHVNAVIHEQTHILASPGFDDWTGVLGHERRELFELGMYLKSLWRAEPGKIHPIPRPSSLMTTQTSTEAAAIGPSEGPPTPRGTDADRMEVEKTPPENSQVPSQDIKGYGLMGMGSWKIGVRIKRLHIPHMRGRFVVKLPGRHH